VVLIHFSGFIALSVVLTDLLKVLRVEQLRLHPTHFVGAVLDSNLIGLLEDADVVVAAVFSALAEHLAALEDHPLAFADALRLRLLFVKGLRNIDLGSLARIMEGLTLLLLEHPRRVLRLVQLNLGRHRPLPVFRGRQREDALRLLLLIERVVAQLELLLLGVQHE